MLLKLLFDRVVSLLGLLMLWPVLLIIAVLIRLKMPGDPVMFSQQRVGRHARLFRIYKFRTMVVDHDGSSVSVRGESRITPIGLHCAGTSWMNCLNCGMCSRVT